MKLSMEEVRKQHESTKKLYEQGLTVAPVDVQRVLDLYDTIEALQQENEQLRTQVARMREALIECVNALELCTHDELCKIAVSPYDMIQDAKEALAAIDKVIGGKEE